jgi:hypothetical protein
MFKYGRSVIRTDHFDMLAFRNIDTVLWKNGSAITAFVRQGKAPNCIALQLPVATSLPKRKMPCDYGSRLVT